MTHLYRERMNPDLERLLELQDMITKYDGNIELRNQKEYEQLKSKLNEKLEKLTDNYIGIEKSVFETMKKEDKEQEQQIKQLKEIIHIKLVQEKLLAGILGCDVEKLGDEIQLLKEYKISWKKAEESYIYMHRNDYKEIQSLKDNCYGHCKELIHSLESKNEKYQKALDEINQYIDTPLQVQNGTRNKLKSILKEVEKE